MADEELPEPEVGAILDFAVYLDGPLGIQERAGTGRSHHREESSPRATHVRPGLYDVAGRVVESRRIQPSNSWQYPRDCIVDLGQLVAFGCVRADVDAAPPSPGETLVGRVRPRIDYAERGTPLPMIYSWNVLRMRTLDPEAGPAAVWAQLLPFGPCSERHDYSIVLERMNPSPGLVALVADLRGLNASEAEALFRAAPLTLMDGLTESEWREVTARLKGKGAQVSHEWTPWKWPGIPRDSSERKIDRTYLRSQTSLKSSVEGWVPD